jgi:thiamine pyrophosphate-dependent acetolactate synthase large subunit-like protein
MPSANGWGSDRIVRLLTELGYRYVAFNPGATFRGLHDSLANVDGAPHIVMATHEEISVAIAHGYAKAAGEPMAALVHDVVGLQHASMAVYNAWCDQAPVLVLGGTGPVDAAHRRPYIDWVHTALVQGQLVRDYVKWDDQPASLAASLDAVARADRIIRAEPPGPAYVCLDVEIQEAAVDDGPPVTRAAPPAPIHPDPAAIEQAADWLVAADRPLAVADMLGRSPHAVAPLIRLAERLGMPVIDLGGRFNFPTTHPLDATDAGAALEVPDLVLALDVVDLAGPLQRIARETGGTPPRLIHVTTRDLGLRSWAAQYQAVVPVDLAVTAEAGPAVDALLAACEGRSTPAAGERLERARRLHRRRRADWQRTAEATAAEEPIAVAWLFLRLREALGARRWSLVNGPIESPWPRRLLRLEEPWQYLGGSGGAGIGYAAGASIGAALALRDRGILAVDVQGDGDLLYTPGAIWTAVHERIPLLLVIANNRSYFNSENHADTMARIRSRPPENARVGTRIVEPAVDFAALARSMGAAGHGPVSDPSALEAVLAAAIDDVEAGAIAVVDVVCQPR